MVCECRERPTCVKTISDAQTPYLLQRLKIAAQYFHIIINVESSLNLHMDRLVDAVLYSSQLDLSGYEG